jgi:hypothetical protein
MELAIIGNVYAGLVTAASKLPVSETGVCKP